MSYNGKTVGLIIPTRMDSERLPGKALIDINGKPNLERIIRRACLSKHIDKVVLAVSENDIEGQIEHWFAFKFKNPSSKISMNLEYGPHENIYIRTLNAARNNNIDIIVDISHCCTLFDPFMADHLIENLFYFDADYSTNVVPRSFSDGFDIQVYTRRVYEEVYMKGIHRKNYWTGWNIWHCREEIKPKPRIINLQTSLKKHYRPHWKLTLDTEEQLFIIRDIYKHFEGINFQYPEVIAYVENKIKYDPFYHKILETDIIESTKLEEEPC